MRGEELIGLWTRSLLAWPDGRRDETTIVDWLQGPTFFVDLRSPAGRPSFSGVERLRDLSVEQVAWLATQEGFAGELRSAGAFFEWRRAIDLQPATGAADAGSLRMEDGVLVERGRDAPYLEHWRRQSPPDARPAVAYALRDESDGRAGYLVRVGGDFMYARDRARQPPPGSTLTDLVAAERSLAAAQDLVDIELSKGVVLDDGAYRITRSSLPYREGRCLTAAIETETGRISVADSSPNGREALRCWRIEAGRAS